jgi:hypothetical protein
MLSPQMPKTYTRLDVLYSCATPCPVRIAQPEGTSHLKLVKLITPMLRADN